MAEPVLGLDLGGAHLKAALAQGDRIMAARQVPCRLWEGLDRLPPALDAAIHGLPRATRVAVTMTGELVDLFPDRATGVSALIDAIGRYDSEAVLLVWAGRRGFLPPDEAAADPAAVASANWLATATLVARLRPDCLFVDIGSTTTDILPILGGEPRFAGYRDAERLAAGELVYQGLTRTPVMAIAREAPFAGRRVPLMNEHFATAADVWRVLGRLDEAQDQHPAADGGAKTLEASARRLARMLGADLAEADMEAWSGLAAGLAERQLRQIDDALRLVLSRHPLPPAAPMIAAGCGRGLVAELARRLDRPGLEITDILNPAPEASAMAATCAPAVAVALLAQLARSK